MHRFTSISSLCLFLIAITSPSILAASEPQLQRTLRILQDDNNNATNATNDTVPDDATAETNVTAPTAAPQQVTPGATRAPTHAMTHEPTKKYEPEDDEEEKDEEKKHSAFAVGGSIVLIVLGLGILCYFRDAITFFVGSVRMVCINTNRYGCKGCLSTCFPCIFGSQAGYNSGGGDNLDQIIFETEDDNNLRRGLMH
ncbi:hypothetical protein ACHAWO_004533 [Cyclotella atomus]|uniref:Transmembrane protein n=1 Tax=Cyclotella atomus TaxID=382360 RepID=A0ABD3NKQ3_9STRA